jgi:hypothetical protein
MKKKRECEQSQHEFVKDKVTPKTLSNVQGHQHKRAKVHSKKKGSEHEGILSTPTTPTLVNKHILLARHSSFLFHHDALVSHANIDVLPRKFFALFARF